MPNAVVSEVGTSPPPPTTMIRSSVSLRVNGSSSRTSGAASAPARPAASALNSAAFSNLADSRTWRSPLSLASSLTLHPASASCRPCATNMPSGSTPSWRAWASSSSSAPSMTASSPPPCRSTATSTPTRSWQPARPIASKASTSARTRRAVTTRSLTPWMGRRMRPTGGVHTRFAKLWPTLRPAVS
jgi:hypothetical protein